MSSRSRRLSFICQVQFLVMLFSVALRAQVQEVAVVLTSNSQEIRSQRIGGEFDAQKATLNCCPPPFPGPGWGPAYHRNDNEGCSYFDGDCPGVPSIDCFLSANDYLISHDEVTHNGCASAWYAIPFSLPVGFFDASIEIKGVQNASRDEGLNVDDQGILYINEHRLTGHVDDDSHLKSDPQFDGSGLRILTWPAKDQVLVTDQAYFVEGTNAFILGLYGDAQGDPAIQIDDNIDPTGFELSAMLRYSILDCNGNGVSDELDIASGASVDCNGNGIPDECELVSDCNANGVLDECELDCDRDGIPDECEEDCNLNGVPDECESFSDCNGNGVPDICDIQSGGSQDVDGDGVPDECTPGGVESFCLCDGGSVCFLADSTAGCPNSTAFGGVLAASGTTSVSSDDLVLVLSSLPASQSTVMFMGTQQTSQLFGAGIRCVGGAVFRYPIQTASSLGQVSYTDIVVYAEKNFPGTGQISAGTTWFFQGWYRDPFGPCDATFNLTSALSVVFAP